MKKHIKKHIPQGSTYIECSECLRKELELKIDILYLKNTFPRYAIRYADFANTNELVEFLDCNLVCGENYTLSVAAGDLIKGINTWFNMDYADRISVMEKFNDCYCNSMPLGASSAIDIMPVVFCKFLIDELMGILASPQWRLLNNRIHLN